MRVTVLFFHPFPRRSLVNRALRAAAAEVPGVTVRDLYERYPDYGIDVAAEQEHLRESDVIVFQHPFYWYSCPALMKEWMDAVLEFGWAYGEGGEHLRGKYWVQAITTGGQLEAYARSGHNEFTIPELLRPFEGTARLCGMKLLEPFLVHGARQPAPGAVERESVRYKELLEGLRDGKLPPIYTTVG